MILFWLKWWWWRRLCWRSRIKIMVVARLHAWFFLPPQCNICATPVVLPILHRGNKKNAKRQFSHKGTQDLGQRLSTPVQFFKLWSHWSKNDGSNLGSHWWKYCLRICAKPNIWNNNNVRNWTFIVLQGVIRAVDQGKGSHQQAQPLPEVRVFYLAYLQKHLFALWMGSGEAQIWRWSEWDLGTWGLGSHESGEDEA